MRIRLKFQKLGRLKYIGHLDLLNIFNRAVKAAKLPVEYSKGFNPHMKITFAAPLPLGIESMCEYADIDFDDGIKQGELTANINERFPEGLRVTDFYILNEPYKKAPAIVAKAKYDIDGVLIPHEQLQAFMMRETILTIKKTKSKEELTDIKPDIYDITPANETSITATLSCGSMRNLKPGLLIRELTEFCGINVPLHKINITRTEIYGLDGKPLCEHL
jgi:radical SAM-linked protein